jgi:hypothetical protein
MYIGDKGLAQVSPVAPLEFKASLFPKNVTRFSGENESRVYEFSSEESEGEEDNREVKDDPLNSSSPEGRVKGENENRDL